MYRRHVPYPSTTNETPPRVACEMVSRSTETETRGGHRRDHSLSPSLDDVMAGASGLPRHAGTVGPVAGHAVAAVGVRRALLPVERAGRPTVHPGVHARVGPAVHAGISAAVRHRPARSAGALRAPELLLAERSGAAVGVH